MLFSLVNRFIKRLLWLCSLVWTALPLHAQSHHQQIQAALPSIMDSTGIPGMSIALIENGQITWSDGLGISHKTTHRPVTSTTIFRGASLGKPLFAYAVLKLNKEGIIDLDTPLVKYVPLAYLEKNFFNGPLSDDRIRLITARMVLHHTSGLPNWRAEGKPVLTMFLPGSRYSYSGEGYYLLQQVVEYLLKEPAESFMQRFVFKPLGMNHTSYRYNPVDSLLYAHSYDMTGKLVVDEPEPVNVAHTLRTTANDYAQFLIHSLLSGSSEQPSQTLISSPVDTDICQPGKVSWGLGLAVQHAADGDLFCQWAKSPMSSGYVIGSTQQKRAVVYVVNVANQGLRIAERVVKLSLNYDDPLFSCFGVRPYNARP